MCCLLCVGGLACCFSLLMYLYGVFDLLCVVCCLLFVVCCLLFVWLLFVWLLLFGCCRWVCLIVAFSLMFVVFLFRCLFDARCLVVNVLVGDVLDVIMCYLFVAFSFLFIVVLLVACCSFYW